MIMNMVGGGGAGLNFTVKAYASLDVRPASANENTIAVITDTAVPEWAISATEPSEPISGMLWIFSDTSGSVHFNALKKNSIVIFPGSVMQFVNGSWKYVDAYIFQNGQWVQFALAWDGYYFRDGEQYMEITGGWSSDGWSSTGTATVGSILEVSSSGAFKPAYIGTASPVDLTKVDTLYFDSTTGKNGKSYSAYLYVSTTKDRGNIVKQAVITDPGVGSIDVSDLSGYHYLTLYTLGGASGSGYGSVRAIWRNNAASGGGESGIALLSLDNDPSDNAVFMEVEGMVYGINNATMNDEPTSKSYDFTVL